ncbi:uncharacterized protein TM35_000101560 [Trypanosoma theileri]|uniref:Cullin family profile domain-containing protein n=1 Tax=Trypanosoma theileri TaxID=67003 RepID=A0A1X0NZB9_9TRYP|nr:uncharacterized protein TM35_000101560 [Trypanosoma theileri]ORC89888.1 hypothetical protein TM35_000101560 [Trypanosoma theileri]
MISFSFSFSTCNHNNNNSNNNNNSSSSRSTKESSLINDSPSRPQGTGSLARIQERPSVDEVWPEVEAYLMHAAHVIRTGNAEMKERLQNVRTRMSWYAVIYSTCSGNPKSALEMYRRLVLFLINDLEVNVLRPFLRKDFHLHSSSSTSSSSSSSSSGSICQQFVLQYKLFMNFRRVVLSCFGYLDQYYTTKFSLDEVTVLCVKVFYVVVYKPIREMLVEGMLAVAHQARVAYQNNHFISSPASVEVQKTLAAITEIVSTVKKYSTARDINIRRGAGTATSNNGMEIGIGGTAGVGSSSGSGKNTLYRIIAEVEKLQKSLGINGKTKKYTRDVSPLSVFASGDSNHNSNNSNSSGSGSDSNNGSPTREKEAVDFTSLDNIRILREKLENRTIADVITGQLIIGSSSNNSNSSSGNSNSFNYPPFTTMSANHNTHNNHNNTTATIIGNNNYYNYNSNSSSGSGRGRGSNAKSGVDLAQVVIVNAIHPLYLLIFADFGIPYILAAEAYYRDQRTLHLAQPSKRWHYMSWVQECFEFEHYMVRDVMSTNFHAVLREQLQYILLVEVHRLVILDENFGFRAQLDTWSGRNGGIVSMDTVQYTSTTPTNTLNSTDTVVSTNNTTTIPTVMSIPSSSSVKSWEQLSDDELLRNMHTFVMAFINTQDESSWELLASEFASKIITETAGFFDNYMTLKEAIPKEKQRSSPSTTTTTTTAAAAESTHSIHLDVNALNNMRSTLTTTPVKQQQQQQQQRSSSNNMINNNNENNNNNNNNRDTTTVVHMRRRTGDPAAAASVSSSSSSTQDPAMGLIVKLVEATIKYSNLLRKQFDNYLPLQSAMRDAFHEIINPEQWGQLGGRVSLRGSAAVATSELPSVLLNHDAAKKTVAVLNKLSTLRGDEEIPTAQFLANYCDYLCRREMNNGDVESQDVIARMDAVAYLVSLIDDKDIFLEHYKLQLAHRLLLLHSPMVSSLSRLETGMGSTGLSTHLNMDGERLLLRKLQQVLGRTLTYSLEAMLRDYESTLNGGDLFHRIVEEKELLLPADIQVRVLTAVHWPTYRVIPLIPCTSLAVGMEAYTEFYKNLHPSRSLHWIHTLGSATLHAVFPRGTKEIVANTMQSHILILVSNAYNAGRSLDKVKKEEDPVLPSTTTSTTTTTTITTIPSSSKDESMGIMEDKDNNTNDNDCSVDKMINTPRRSISGQDIATAMGMDFKSIRVHLAPLVHHKVYNLLTRVKPSNRMDSTTTTTTTTTTNTTTNTIPFSSTSFHISVGMDVPLSPEDEFTLNVDYMHKLRKFKLPVARVFPVHTAGGKGRACGDDDNNDGTSSLSSAIEDTRRLQIDAAIIRIMKSRRSLRYYELFDATVQQLSKLFTPRARSVKTQVEDLVGRGFIQRNETDATVFEYIA